MTVWTAEADRADPTQLVPGAHYVVCVDDTIDGVVMAGPDASGLLVLSTAGLNGQDYRELPSPDGHLNFGVGTCLPDGRVAVEAWDNDDASRSGIYVVDLGGAAAPERITKPPAGETDIPGCVVADGSIAFLRAGIDNTPGTLNLIRSDGSDDPIGDEPYATGPACSPDGTQLLAELQSDIYLVDPLDGERRSRRLRSYGPTFGPGNVISFSLLAPGPFHDLYAMRLDGSGLTRLTDQPSVDNETPRWATD